MGSRPRLSAPATAHNGAEPARAGRSVACVGCGEQPEDLHPTDAIASLRLLERRSELLLRHCRQAALTCNPGGGMPQSAVEPTVRLEALLSAADRRLRSILGEYEPPPPQSAPPTPRIFSSTTAEPLAPIAPATLAETADRLVRAIAGATTEDWYRRRRIESVSAAELIWLALHDAAHDLEDVDLALARAASRAEDPVTDGSPERGAPSG